MKLKKSIRLSVLPGITYAMDNIALNINAGEGVYLLTCMKANKAGRWLSRAAAKDNRPLVKHEPFPAPNDDTTTLIGIMTAAAPRTWLPHVLGGKKYGHAAKRIKVRARD